MGRKSIAAVSLILLLCARTAYAVPITLDLDTLLTPPVDFQPGVGRDIELTNLMTLHLPIGDGRGAVADTLWNLIERFCRSPSIQGIYPTSWQNSRLDQNLQAMPVLMFSSM